MVAYSKLHDWFDLYKYQTSYFFLYPGLPTTLHNGPIKYINIAVRTVSANSWYTWWCHDMGLFALSMGICGGNPPVTGRSRQNVHMESLPWFNDGKCEQALALPSLLLWCWFRCRNHDISWDFSVNSCCIIVTRYLKYANTTQNTSDWKVFILSTF